MTAGKQATWQRGVDEEGLESWPYGRVRKEENRLEAEVSRENRGSGSLVSRELGWKGPE
jgi:hypothetical protein